MSDSISLGGIKLSIDDKPTDPPKRKRGRPPGSKNKPKAPPASPVEAPKTEGTQASGEAPKPAGETPGPSAPPGDGPPPIAPQGTPEGQSPPPPISDIFNGLPPMGLAQLYGGWLMAENAKMAAAGWPIQIPDEVIKGLIVPSAEYLESEVFKNVKLSKKDAAYIVVGAPMINSAAFRLLKGKVKGKPVAVPMQAPAPPQAPAPVEPPSPPPKAPEEPQERPGRSIYAIGG